MLQRLRYSPFLVQMVVIRRCNLTCGYCNEYDDSSPPVDGAELRARIDHVARLGAFSLELTGGEPLLHPELPALVAHARSRSIGEVMLISNAFLMNEERIGALNDAGLTNLQVSVDGVEPNDVTVKVLKCLRPKLDLLARHARFRVTLSAVVGSASPHEALEVIDYAKQKGFRPRVLLIHGHDGQLRLDADDRRAFERLRRELGGRWNEARDYRSRLLCGEPAPFKCRAGSRYLYVDETGIVRWCSQTFRDFGIPLAAFSTADLARQFHTKKPCSDYCTLGCARTTSAWDQLRSQHLAPDPAYTGATPLFQLRTPARGARG